MRFVSLVFIGGSFCWRQYLFHKHECQAVSWVVATQTTLLWDADGMLPAAGGCVYVVGGKSLLAAQCCCEPSTALNKQTSAAWI